MKTKVTFEKKRSKLKYAYEIADSFVYLQTVWIV